jgi:type IV pilus assembly protein PilM
VVEADRQEQTIAYEVQQNLPYDLSEVVWDVQELRNDGVELEVVVVAVRSVEAEEFCRVVSEAKVRAEALGAASLLDANSFRAACGEPTEDTLLVNVGARSSNILMIGEGGLFSRNVPLGGNAITEGLADSLGLSFLEAERLKLRVFSSSGSGPPLEEGVEASAVAVGEDFMRRLGVEISRSIANFRRLSKGGAPRRVLLAGAGSALPGFADHLQGRLRIVAEYLDPGAALGRPLPGGAGGVNPLLRDSELIGQAHAMTSPGGENVVNIDILPGALRERAAFSRRKPALLVAACTLVVAGLITLAHLRGVLTAQRAKMAGIEMASGPAQAIQREMGGLIEEMAMLRMRFGQLENVSKTKSNWLRFLSDMQDRLGAVEDVWLEEASLLPAKESSGQLPAEGMRAGEAFSGATPSSPSGTNTRLLLAGRMLDRENPLARVSPHVQRRVNQLISSFAESTFISAIEDRKFDTSENGLLHFQFTVLVDPENPL